MAMRKIVDVFVFDFSLLVLLYILFWMLNNKIHIDTNYNRNDDRRSITITRSSSNQSFKTLLIGPIHQDQHFKNRIVLIFRRRGSGSCAGSRTGI